MIIVEVYFAEMNRFYDLKLDEDAQIGQVIDDMVGVITQKEHVTLSQQTGPFALCSVSKQRVLDSNSTLAQNGICSGDALLLL